MSQATKCPPTSPTASPSMRPVEAEGMPLARDMGKERTWDEVDGGTADVGEKKKEEWVLEGEKKLSRYLEAKRWKKAAGSPDPPRRRIESQLDDQEGWVTLEEMTRIVSSPALDEGQMNFDAFPSTNHFEDVEEMDLGPATAAPHALRNGGLEFPLGGALSVDGQNVQLQDVSSSLTLEAPTDGINASIATDAATGISLLSTLLDAPLIALFQRVGIDLYSLDPGALSVFTYPAGIYLPDAPMQGALAFNASAWDAALQAANLEVIFGIRERRPRVVEEVEEVGEVEEIGEEMQTADPASHPTRFDALPQKQRGKKRAREGESWDIQTMEKARIKRPCFRVMSPVAVGRRVEEGRKIKRDRKLRRLGRSRWWIWRDKMIRTVQLDLALAPVWIKLGLLQDVTLPVIGLVVDTAAPLASAPQEAKEVVAKGKKRARETEPKKRFWAEPVWTRRAPVGKPMARRRMRGRILMPAPPASTESPSAKRRKANLDGGHDELDACP